ncbi:hypothetical protein [Planobispora longispora]|uniref:hypothetical protein n=1 Tax=Planobispora longispora TaxID=28887 RepID=UPI0019405EE5|nr:hypothetical protein [Planobispora longispora]
MEVAAPVAAAGESRTDARAHARAGGLVLLLTPLITVAFLVVQLVAIRYAEHPADPMGISGGPRTSRSLGSVGWMAYSARVWTWGGAVFTLPVAVLLALLGRRVLRHGAEPGYATVTGIGGVFHLLGFAFVTRFNAMTSAVSADDQSGFIAHNPGWQPPAMLALVVLAGLLPAAAMFLLARVGRLDRETREAGPGGSAGSTDDP